MNTYICSYCSLVSRNTHIMSYCRPIGLSVLKAYTVSQKKHAAELLSIPLLNRILIDFQVFHWHTPRKLCNNIIIKDHTTP